MNYKTPRTDALRALFENEENRANMGDVWDLCEELEKEVIEARYRAGVLMSTIRVNTLSNRWKDVTYEEVDAFLKSLASDEPFDPWLPIETRPPEEKRSMLVYCAGYRNIYTAFHEAGFWWHFAGGTRRLTEEPTHWMPLPEPPKP
jgi:hypothetical protein